MLEIRQEETGKSWPGTWYVHKNDLQTIRNLEKGRWKPRTTLLSPFDNLICDRKRTERIFNFKYSFELYVPKHKRKYGTYVLPILLGDRFIGRIDPKLDKEANILRINAVHMEPDVSLTKKITTVIENVVGDLATFLGANEVVHSDELG